MIEHTLIIEPATMSEGSDIYSDEWIGKQIPLSDGTVWQLTHKVSERPMPPLDSQCGSISFRSTLRRRSRDVGYFDLCTVEHLSIAMACGLFVVSGHRTD